MATSEGPTEFSGPLAEAGRDLIICCDGTNNTVTGYTQDTNVLQLVAHLRANPSPNRLVYYDPGVGTADAAPPTSLLDWAHRTGQRIAGLASGKGVYDNIGMAYLFLMKNWRSNADRIFCFGFSRGAFTARCVAGMVHLFGVLKPEHEVLIPTLIHIYFSQPQATAGFRQRFIQKIRNAITTGQASIIEGASAASSYHPDARQRLADEIRVLFTTTEGQEAWVHWVGVWDTVESVGLPGPLAMSNPSTANLRGKRIRNARHALSFDEHRWTFEPRLYEEPKDIHDPPGGQSVEQRWFSGVHCDVGGGYLSAEAGMSDETFRWMVGEVASNLGVPTPSPREPTTRLRHDAIWATPWWALAGMCLRNMKPRTAEGKLIEIIPGDPESTPSKSVWDIRRALWPIAVAVILGLFFVILSGAALTEGGLHALHTWDDAIRMASSFVQFEIDTFDSVRWRGLLLDGNAPWDIARHSGRTLFWSLGFVVCWGYVVARFTSKAFAWLAGRRGPDSTLPLWRALGMAPFVAVASNLSEVILLVLALMAHGAHLHHGVWIPLLLAGVASAGKLVGWAGCFLLLLLRLGMFIPWLRAKRPL
jgi:uncharacterized protein (DUF2235 family)